MQIHKTFPVLVLALVALAVTGCQKTQTGASVGGSGSGNTPTEAYRSLYEAVKSKNTDAIKANMSKETIQFAEGVGQMQKKTPEEMFKNGFTETTMSDSFPPIRNERIKENFAALEVQSPKGIWEDLPFVNEDGRWKLAIGELFKGAYKKPAPSQAETEPNNNNFPPAAPAGNTGAPTTQVMPGDADKAPDAGNKKPEKTDSKSADAKSEASGNNKK